MAVPGMRARETRARFSRPAIIARTPLPKQQRRELVQVRPPVGPGVPALRLLVRVADLVLVQQGERRLRARQDEVVLPGGEPEEPDAIVDLRIGEHGRVVLRKRRRTFLAEPAGAEYA